MFTYHAAYFGLNRTNQDARYEYVDGYAYMLAGGTRYHSLICSNINHALRLRLDNHHVRYILLMQPYKLPADVISTRICQSVAMHAIRIAKAI